VGSQSGLALVPACKNPAGDTAGHPILRVHPAGVSEADRCRSPVPHGHSHPLSPIAVCISLSSSLTSSFSQVRNPFRRTIAPPPLPVALTVRTSLAPPLPSLPLLNLHRRVARSSTRSGSGSHGRGRGSSFTLWHQNRWVPPPLLVGSPFFPSSPFFPLFRHCCACHGDAVCEPGDSATARACVATAECVVCVGCVLHTSVFPPFSPCRCVALLTAFQKLVPLMAYATIEDG
jgi:hypothetical protein